MRIAYFTDTYYPEINGVTNTLSHLHTYLNQHQIEHIFISPEYQGEAVEEGIYRFRSFTVPFSPNSRLAEGVLALADDSAKRAQLAVGALQTAKNRSWESIMDGLMDSYEAVLCSIQRKPA